MRDNEMKFSKKDKKIIWFFLSIPMILLLSSLNHYLGDWFNSCPFFNLWTPTSESVWEHLKIIFYPTIVWWTIFYFAGRNYFDLDINNTIVAAVSSAMVGVIFLLMSYYTLHIGFGLDYLGLSAIQKLPYDILLEILALSLGQLVGYHILNKGSIKRRCAIVFCFIAVGFAVLCAVLSFIYPNLPVFISE